MKSFLVSPLRLVRASSSLATRTRNFGVAVTYEKYGNPKEVLKVNQTADVDASKLAAKDIYLKFLAAPINPSDLNMVEGVYGVKATFPAVGGNEGVAEVVQVGSSVTSVQPGDWVIPGKAAFGTWTQFKSASADDVIKVPKNIPIAYAATISVNPCTAFRLLHDFEKLSKGDVVIQNGANSMVGLAVVQIAREMGIKTVNIVRSDRPDAETALRLLTNLGGDINILDVHSNSHYVREMLAELPGSKLALNCVGGESATNLLRMLGSGGTLVSYGNMAKQAFPIPSELVADKQLKLTGFWMNKWNESNSVEERTKMINEVAKMIADRKLSFFYEMHDLDDFSYALERSTEQFNFRKIVLNNDYPDRMKEHDERNSKEYEVFETGVV